MQPLTRDLIENGALTEGAACDFKSKLDLNDARAKSNLIDDVVAFLNSGAGRIIVGVEERGGAFHAYRPITGDRDKVALRLLSVIQDNVEPTPLRVEARTMEVDDGFVIDIVLPEHRLRPYQNKITGGFQIRTGAKNRALPRDAIQAMFVKCETYEADLLRMIEEEEARLAARDILLVDGPSLQVSILPLEHYQRGIPSFDRGHGRLKAAPFFHDRGSAVFKGCEGGHEALYGTMSGRAIERLFIGNTWFFHAHAVHPIGSDSERVKIYELQAQIAAYLEDLGALIEGEALHGPFCIMLAIRNLGRSDKLAWAFPSNQSVTLPRPMLAEQVASADLAQSFYDLVRRASIYG